MLLLTLTSPVLGANCYVVASDAGEECVLVDPGVGIDEQIGDVLAQHSLRPAGVLITHGHVDHTFSAPALSRRYDVPVYIHAADEYRLDDPVRTLGPDLAMAFASLGAQWSRPPRVRTFQAGASLEVAGLTVEVIHAPGHTEGSTLYVVPRPEDHTGSLCFTGDVLFVGTVGRTDLPGGDPHDMHRTLAELARPEADGGLPDDTTVLPGHGDSDSLGRHRATNPFLQNVRGHQ
ncbi:MBL fold metallo-hydrolase [Phytoactinopolyspora limicola]|uniref:MBL fold metallo-hydrolase n=1 Tax=Phytoactinopolyspora limicola TaxID=2715536 RepID=UPI00140D373B|nr:MBL fold metallo-hydrolase [Phytoactinopolyspora limicola]